MFIKPLDTSCLGAKVEKDGVSFGLWAPYAKRVELPLVGLMKNQRNVEMREDGRGVWHVFVPGIGEGREYGYHMHGDWAPDRGRRFNPTRLLFDPYARAVTSGIGYRGPIHNHLAHDDFRPDATDSFGAMPLSVVVADTPAPPPVAGGRRPTAESVIYEMHVRGLTKIHPLVPEHPRGSCAALTHPDVISYLLGTGVMTVELLPIHHYASEPFIAHKGLNSYWGYNTLSCFAPHVYYATRGALGNQVTEFKAMVAALHDTGIEVILDVVYNHTAEGGHEGPTLFMRDIDHAGYYRLTDDLGDGYDVTGCGNSANSATPMVWQLIVDSLRYWVKYMGVDGFRFDLAPILFRNGQHHFIHDHPLKQQIDSDPAFAGVKLIAESRDIGPYGYQLGSLGLGWSKWNDRFRDHVCDYWKSTVHGVQELATRLSGSPDVLQRNGRPPQVSINFVTAHDGFTMRDLVSYDVKHNSANGEGNHNGSDNNRSWNHGFEGDSGDPAINDLQARQVLNMHATQVLTAGTSMILTDDKFGRIQKGNNNAYCQDSPLSWVDWTPGAHWQAVRSRLAELLCPKTKHPLLCPGRYLHHTDVISAHGENLGRADLTWFNDHGTQMTEQDWHDRSRRLLGMYVSDEANAFLTQFYSGAGPMDVTLPGLPWAARLKIAWHLAGTDELPSEELSPGSVLRIPGRCAVLMCYDVPTIAAELLGMPLSLMP